MECPLCKAEYKTRWFYEDDYVYVTYCSSHPTQPMIVLRRHGQATEWELGYMTATLNILFLWKNLRTEPRSIKEHAHWHVEEPWDYVGT